MYGHSRRHRVLSRLLVVASLVVVLGLVLSACGAKATPTAAPVATEAATAMTALTPTTAPVATQAPTQVPTAAATAAAPQASPTTAASDASLKGTIVGWSWEGAIEYLQALVPAFNEKYPNIKVDLQKLGAADVHTKLVAALAAGTGAPDFAQVSSWRLGGYDAAALASLNQWMEPIKDKFAPSMMQVATRNGKIIAVPWDSGPCAVIYRRDIYEQYGVSPDQIETWDDFMKAGQTVVEKSGGKVKMGLAGTDGEVFLMIAVSSGGNLFDKDGNLTIDSPENVKALELMGQMRRLGITENIPSWGDEAYASYNQGSVASYFGAVWYPVAIKKYGKAEGTSGKWGVYMLPAFAKGGSRAVDEGGSTLVIPEQSKNKELAWKFLEFALANADSGKTMLEKFDIFPAWTPTYDQPFFRKPVAFYGGQPAYELYGKIAATAGPYYRPAGFMEAFAAVGTAMDEFFSGKKTAQRALSDAQAAMKTKLGQ